MWNFLGGLAEDVDIPNIMVYASTPEEVGRE